jgi:hypothetical protein
MNSDGFIFDQQIIGQIVVAGFRMMVVAVPTRYFLEAFSASLVQSSIYRSENSPSARSFCASSLRGSDNTAVRKPERAFTINQRSRPELAQNLINPQRLAGRFNILYTNDDRFVRPTLFSTQHPYPPPDN